MVRGLAWHTLRGYAFSLTNFIRWWVECHATEEVTEQALGDSSLLDYLRYLSDQEPRPAANTINKAVSGARMRTAESRRDPRRGQGLRMENSSRGRRRGRIGVRASEHGSIERST